MSETAPSSEPSAPSRQDEERLIHSLVTRGLILREEADQVRESEPVSPRDFLTKLVKSQFLTLTQARRVAKEITQFLEQQLPGYQLLEKLGQGAMGTVYKARQISMNRLVAVKILLPRLTKKPGYIERFLTEARIAAKLSHNNVVQAIDVGSAPPLHYFVMELVEGIDLRTELDSGIVYPEKDAVEIVLQIAQALQHAHRRGLIHRDVKPANIVLTKDGIAKLADLGLAREAEDRETARKEKGLTVGTPFYIAPEQIHSGTSVDGRADLYSLGATFYHMVTGQPPFPYKGVDAVLEAHLKEKLTPPDHLHPDLSDGLGEVVKMLLAKNRDKRYQTPDDLILDLECLLNEEAPRIARKKIELSTLEALEEEGEEVMEYEIGAPDPTKMYWIIGLAVGLGLSAILNLILMLS